MIWCRTTWRTWAAFNKLFDKFSLEVNLHFLWKQINRALQNSLCFTVYRRLVEDGLTTGCDDPHTLGLQLQSCICTCSLPCDNISVLVLSHQMLPCQCQRVPQNYWRDVAQDLHCTLPTAPEVVVAPASSPASTYTFGANNHPDPLTNPDNTMPLGSRDVNVICLTGVR